MTYPPKQNAECFTWCCWTIGKWGEVGRNDWNWRWRCSSRENCTDLILWANEKDVQPSTEDNWLRANGECTDCFGLFVLLQRKTEAQTRSTVCYKYACLVLYWFGEVPNLSFIHTLLLLPDQPFSNTRVSSLFTAYSKHAQKDATSCDQCPTPQLITWRPTSWRMQTNSGIDWQTPSFSYRLSEFLPLCFLNNLWTITAIHQ